MWDKMGKCLFIVTKGITRWDKVGQDGKVFIYSQKRSKKVGQGTTVLLGEII